MVCTLGVFAQVEVPEFTYVIVPDKFDFQKAENSYDINDLTRFLLKKNGFNVVSPKELTNYDRCDALFADLEMENKMIFTKATLILRNCKGAEVVRTNTGKSKLKDYKKAYHQAIRNALQDFTKSALTIIPMEETTIELPKSSEITVPIGIQEPGVAKVEIDTKVSEEKKMPIEIVEDDVIKNDEDEVYSFESYAIVKNNSNYLIVYDDTLIGALITTSKEGVFLVKTTQFYGVAYKSGNTFVVEREVEGLKSLITMLFKR